MEFEKNREINLLKMSKSLTNYSYKPGTFTCFPITDPKLREVWAADFKDRIIHHLLISNIEPVWEKIFIHDSYACRTGKGAHKATQKIKQILATQKDMSYLHVDIRGFFTNIDKNILFKILLRKNKHPNIIYLTKLIIFHDPKSDYIIKGNERILCDVPLNKSLFGVPNDKGLPIGNYTSQFFANVYLNELDQYVKRILKCHYYFRYMDDVVILNSNIKHLREIARLIDTFLKEKLKIELHPKKTIIQKAHKGIDFLGYVIHPDYSLSRKRVVGNIRSKLIQFNKVLPRPIHASSRCPLGLPRRGIRRGNGENFVAEESAPPTFICTCGFIPASESRGILRNRNKSLTVASNIEEIESIVKKAQAVVNSYWGHFKHANCKKLKQKLYEKHFGELKKYLEHPDNADHFVIKKGIFPIDPK